MFCTLWRVQVRSVHTVILCHTKQSSCSEAESLQLHLRPFLPCRTNGCVWCTYVLVCRLARIINVLIKFKLWPIVTPNILTCEWDNTAKIFTSFNGSSAVPDKSISFDLLGWWLAYSDSNTCERQHGSFAGCRIHRSTSVFDKATYSCVVCILCSCILITDCAANCISQWCYWNVYSYSTLFERRINKNAMGLQWLLQLWKRGHICIFFYKYLSEL